MPYHRFVNKISLTFAVLALAGFTASNMAYAQCVCPADEVINCGHRGTGKNSATNPYPENTIPSFLQGVDEGAQMIELDVMHTAATDGTEPALVVIHDDTVDRTTDGTGCVGDMTLAELKSLDAAYGTEMEGTGVQIPTLEEVLAAVDVDVNIEIKINDTEGCPASDKARLAEDVVAAIENDTADRWIVVSSFDSETLDEVRFVSADIYLGLLDYDGSRADFAYESDYDAVNFNAGISGPEQVQIIHDAGLDANAWTVNEPELMLELFDAGAEMIITDDPDAFVAARDQFCASWECPYDGPATSTTNNNSDNDAGFCSTGPTQTNTTGIWLLLAGLLFAVLPRKKRKFFSGRG